jgi:hypothetical protein
MTGTNLVFKIILHYLSWDEWVDATKILKDNEENRKSRDQLKTEFRQANPMKKSQFCNTNSYLGAKMENPKPKKRKTDKIESKIKLEIPPALVKRLLEDWEYIKVQKFVRARIELILIIISWFLSLGPLTFPKYWICLQNIWPESKIPNPNSTKLF